MLPAWSADSKHDLTQPGLGFDAAKEALVGPEDPWTAAQSAMARYSRVGFEAAAVTSMAVALSMRAPSPGRLRTAELRFGHPFAVVAVAVDESYDRPAAVTRCGPWHGLPVFSAWVAEPEDAAADDAKPA